MSVSTKKQRTKGGVKPSSSEKAANALQQLGSTGFLTFDTLANDEPELVEQDSSDRQVAADAHSGSTNDCETSQGSSKFAGEEIEAEVSVVLKKLTKKDVATRCRALRELTDALNGERTVDYATVLTRTFVAKCYSRCVSDEDAHVRELANGVVKRIAEALDEPAKRRLTQFLRCALPSLLFCAHDEVGSVAAAAQNAFNTLFDSDGAADKNADANSTRRRAKAVCAVREQLAELVETILTEQGELRSRETDGENEATTRRQEAETGVGAKGEHAQQRVAAAYRLLAFTVNNMLAYGIVWDQNDVLGLHLAKLLRAELRNEPVSRQPQPERYVELDQADVLRFLERTCTRMLVRNDRFWKLLNANDKQSESPFASMRCAALRCARTLLYASRMLFTSRASLESPATSSMENECESVLRRVSNSALRNVNSAELRVADEAERTLRMLVQLEKTASKYGSASEPIGSFWRVIDILHFAIPQLSATMNALVKPSSSIAPTAVSRRAALVAALLKSLLRHHALSSQRVSGTAPEITPDRPSGEVGTTETKDAFQEALVRFASDAWSRLFETAKQPRVAVSEQDFDLISRKLCSLTRALLGAHSNAVVERATVAGWFTDRFVGELLLGAGRPLISKRSWQLAVQRTAALLQELDSHSAGDKLASQCARCLPPKTNGDCLFEPLDRALLLVAALCGVPSYANPADSTGQSRRTSASLTDLRFEPFLELVTNQPDLLADFLDDNDDSNNTEHDNSQPRTLVPARQCALVGPALKTLLQHFATHPPTDDISATRHSVFAHFLAVSRFDSTALGRLLDQLTDFFRSESCKVSENTDSDASYFCASIFVLINENEPTLRTHMLDGLVGAKPVHSDLLLTVLERFGESSLASAIETHPSFHDTLHHTAQQLIQRDAVPTAANRRTLQRCVTLLKTKLELASIRNQLFDLMLDTCRTLLHSVGSKARQHLTIEDSATYALLQRCDALFQPLLTLDTDPNAPRVFQLLVEFEFYCRQAEEADAQSDSAARRSITSTVRCRATCASALPTLVDFACRLLESLTDAFATANHDGYTTRRRLDLLVALFTESVGQCPKLADNLVESLIVQLSRLLHDLDPTCLTLLACYADLAFLADAHVLSTSHQFNQLTRLLFSAFRRGDFATTPTSLERVAVTKLKSAFVRAYFTDRCCSALCDAITRTASNQPSSRHIAESLLPLAGQLCAVRTVNRLVIKFGCAECIRMSELHAAAECFQPDELEPAYVQFINSCDSSLYAQCFATDEPWSALKSLAFASPAIPNNDSTELPLASRLLQIASRLEALLADLRAQLAQPDPEQPADAPSRFRFPDKTCMPETLLELIDAATLHTSVLTRSQLDSDALRSLRRMLDAVCSVKPSSVAADPLGYHTVLRFVLSTLRLYSTLSTDSDDDSEQQVFSNAHFDFAVCRITDSFDYLADLQSNMLTLVQNALLSFATCALRIYYSDILFGDDSSRSGTQRALVNELRTEFCAVFQADTFAKLARLFVAHCNQHVDVQGGHRREPFAAGLCRSLCAAVLALPKQTLTATVDAQSLHTILVQCGLQSQCVYISLTASDLLAKHVDLDTVAVAAAVANADTDTDADANESCRLPDWLTTLLEAAARRFADAFQLSELPALSETLWDSLEHQLTHETATAALHYLLVVRLVIRTFETAPIRARSGLAAQLTDRTAGPSLLDGLMRTLFCLMPRTPHIARVAQMQQQRIEQPSRADSLLLAVECFGSPAPDSLSSLTSRWTTLLSAFALATYGRALSAMPALVRDWRAALDRRAQAHVDRVTAMHVSPALIRAEMRSLNDAHARDAHGELRVQTSVKTREVMARYAVAGGELTLELAFKLPENYPIGFVDVEFDTRRIGVPTAKWRKWLLQLSTFMQQQNGSLYECLLIWKRNVDSSFEGIDDCMICYSVVHAGTYQTPQKQCSRCKKRFHAACLYRWFTTSQNATCPLCRELF